MDYTSFIARRYLQFQRKSRNKNFISFITLISIIGVTLGVAALIITLTILGGFEKEIKEKVAGFTTHIQITGFQSQTLPDYDLAVQKMQRKVDGIQHVTPFVAKEAMVRFGYNIEGVIVKGVPPSDPMTGVAKYLVEGKFRLTSSDSTFATCVIGKKLIRKLGAQCGDTLLVFGLHGSFSTVQQPTILPFVIVGVYESGMSEYDDIYVFSGIQNAQKLFMLGPAATGFDITLDDISNAEATAKEIMEVMGYPYYARTVFQLYKNLFTWIQLQKEPIPIILGLIIIVATVNIIGTLLMIVLEKKNQIGILQSMGATRSEIRRIFLYQGTVIGCIGTILGNGIAYALCWSQLHYHYFSLPSSVYFMTSVPILFRMENFAIVSVISLGLCIIASMIPAVVASRLDPLRSIRFH